MVTLLEAAALPAVLLPYSVAEPVCTTKIQKTILMTSAAISCIALL
jgi:hypothetical protein